MSTETPAAPKQTKFNSTTDVLRLLNADATREHFHIEQAGELLQSMCHSRAATAGWWTVKEGDNRRAMSATERHESVPVKLMLTVSELSEAMEAHRKNLRDDKLTHRSGVEVELADAVIRIFDLAGALHFNLGEAIAEKLAVNAMRPDHKLEARDGENGKRY